MQKMSFWQVFALVLGSQIGSGVFMLPSSLSAYGWYAILGWLVAGIGALSLAMVFMGLVFRVTKTGGPHVFVAEAFQSPVLTFFTGWTYWVISAVSSLTVLGSAVGYFQPFLPELSPLASCGLQLFLLVVFAGVNLLGVKNAGRLEFVLMLVKITTLVVVPCVALFYFDPEHLRVASSMPQSNLADLFGLVARSAFLAFWAFIGLETATAPADSIDNPRVTIPKALIYGTLVVLALYLLNSFGIQGFLPHQVLSSSSAPYTLVSERLFGGYWYLLLSFSAGMIFLSNLNAWILTSGQVALGLANDGCLPTFFKAVNRSGAPYWALIISSALIVPFLIAIMDSSLKDQIMLIIDLSVAAFLYVYLLCVLGLIRLLNNEKGPLWSKGLFWASLLALLFCTVSIAMESWMVLLTSFAFVLSGLPLYVFWYRQAAT